MTDFDLRTLSRKILLIVAILSMLVIAEMVLVSAEEPAAAAQDSSQQMELRSAIPDRTPRVRELSGREVR